MIDRTTRFSPSANAEGQISKRKVYHKSGLIVNSYHYREDVKAEGIAKIPITVDDQEEVEALIHLLYGPHCYC